MCFQRRKTPARFPDCKGGAEPCSTHDPDHDYVEQCDDAIARGQECDNPTQTSEASSTKRKRDCPKHRDQKKLPKPLSKPKRDGEGGGGAAGGVASQLGVVKVAG